MLGLCLFVVLHISSNSSSIDSNESVRSLDSKGSRLDNTLILSKNLSGSSMDHLRKHHDVALDGIDDTVTAIVRALLHELETNFI